MPGFTVLSTIRSATRFRLNSLRPLSFISLAFWIRQYLNGLGRRWLVSTPHGGWVSQLAFYPASPDLYTKLTGKCSGVRSKQWESLSCSHCCSGCADYCTAIFKLARQTWLLTNIGTFHRNLSAHAASSAPFICTIQPILEEFYRYRWPGLIKLLLGSGVRV